MGAGWEEVKKFRGFDPFLTQTKQHEQASIGMQV
jgi:hypothetical protein